MTWLRKFLSGSALLIVAFTFVRCGGTKGYVGDIWTSTTAGVIGGTVVSLNPKGGFSIGLLDSPVVPTQDFMSAVLERYLNPIPDAEALPFCTTLGTPASGQQDTLSCVDFYNTGRKSILLFTYDRCVFSPSSVASRGVFKTYLRYELPDDTTVAPNYFSANQTACQYALNASTFGDSTLMAYLQAMSTKGYPIVRGWGETANNSNTGFRVSAASELVHVWTDFGSGWQDPNVMGGVKIWVDSSTKFHAHIDGIHLRDYISASNEKIPDLGADGGAQTALDAFIAKYDVDATDPSSPLVKIIDDHTINSVNAWPKHSDGSYLDVSELPNQDARPFIRYYKSPKWATGGDAVSLGGGNYTRETGAQTADDDPYLRIDYTDPSNPQVTEGVIRVQYNLKETKRFAGGKSIARIKIKTPLVFGDSKCCFPTQGVLRSDFDQYDDGQIPPLNTMASTASVAADSDRVFSQPWDSEELEFHAPCGTVDYRIFDDGSKDSPSRKLKVSSNVLFHCY